MALIGKSAPKPLATSRNRSTSSAVAPAFAPAEVTALSKPTKACTAAAPAPTIAALTGISLSPMPEIPSPTFCTRLPAPLAATAVSCIRALIPESTDVTPSCRRMTKSITLLILFPCLLV